MARNANYGDDVIVPLTGKPYFSVILTKSHVKPTYSMRLPKRFQLLFPQALTPVVLFRGEKSWKGFYHGENKNFQRFNPSWKAFVHDNGLKIGDGCVFELLDLNKGEFKVQILRDNTSNGSGEGASPNGKSSHDPILIE